ncbi:hypothetical protein HDR66_01390 [bacterium]|nr:hypothetical protein [bacterium]
MRPGIWQILLVIVLIIILFGSNKIPEMMRNLAGGINVFKKELKDAPTAETFTATAPKKRTAKKSVAKTASDTKKTTAKKSAGKKAK